MGCCFDKSQDNVKDLRDVKSNNRNASKNAQQKSQEEDALNPFKRGCKFSSNTLNVTFCMISFLIVLIDLKTSKEQIGNEPKQETEINDQGHSLTTTSLLYTQ